MIPRECKSNPGGRSRGGCTAFADDWTRGRHFMNVFKRSAGYCHSANTHRFLPRSGPPRRQKKGGSGGGGLRWGPCPRHATIELLPPPPSHPSHSTDACGSRTFLHPCTRSARHLYPCEGRTSYELSDVAVFPLIKTEFAVKILHIFLPIFLGDTVRTSI